MYDYQDIEVVTLQRNLDLGRWSPTEVAGIRRAINDRKQQLQAGLLDGTAQSWTRKLKAEVDPLLRMRNDPDQGFVIDRWTGDCWHQIPGKIGKQTIRPGLCERMKGEYDMQKVSSPKEDQLAVEGKARHPYLKLKDKKSGKIRRTNEQKSTNKVLAAVDSMSEKRIKNFLDVERARHTGEKIIHHGADLRFVEHVAEASKSSPAIPEDMGEHCANPGMNPKVYKRAKGGRHVNE